MESSSLGLRLRMMSLSAASGCGPQRWLFYASIPGALVVGRWLWAWRARDRMRLLLPLAIYHYGLIGFSLIDFQWYGDLLVLLQSAAFFLASLWVALYRLALQHFPRAGGAVAVLACLLAVAAARPGPLRPRLELTRTQPPVAGVTLADQREVADALQARIGAARIAFVEHSELLYLMRRRNGLPVIFWNRPTWSYYRLSPDESYLDAALRTIRSADPDVVIVPDEQRHFLPDPETGEPARIRIDFRPFLRGYEPVELASASGRYRVTAFFRDRHAGGAGSSPSASAAPAPDVDPQAVERLRALGYVDHGEPLAPEAPIGVVHFDRERSAPGINFFTETKSCTSSLMDLEGRVLHSWSHRPCYRWDNTVLLPDGDLLVTGRLFDARSPADAEDARYLMRLGWDGSIRWQKRLAVHHDVELTPDGRVLVLAHRLRQIPEIHPTLPVRDNLLVLLSADGAALGELSLWDALSASETILPIQRVDPVRFEGQLEIDLFHANAVEWIRPPSGLGATDAFS